MTGEKKGGRLQYTRATSACTQRSIDRTHVRFDENLHATSCGLSPSLLIKSSVTILSRYPRGVETAPIMVAMMMTMIMMMMMMMMVVAAKGEHRQIMYGVNVYVTHRIRRFFNLQLARVELPVIRFIFLEFFYSLESRDSLNFGFSNLPQNFHQSTYYKITQKFLIEIIQLFFRFTDLNLWRSTLLKIKMDIIEFLYFVPI